jgi:hypothetical protein
MMKAIVMKAIGFDFLLQTPDLKLQTLESGFSAPVGSQET